VFWERKLGISNSFSENLVKLVIIICLTLSIIAIQPVYSSNNHSVYNYLDARSNSYAKTYVLNNVLLNDLFLKRLEELNYTITRSAFSNVVPRTLPLFPYMSFKIINETRISKTPVLVFNEMYTGGLRYSFKPSHAQSLKGVLRELFNQYYVEALSLFYNTLPSLSTGSPMGSYSLLSLSGFKEVVIPPSISEARLTIKPSLLLILVGPSNNTHVYGPFITYYFAFKTNGVLYDGSIVSVIIVLSICIDNANILYPNGVSVGVSAYYILSMVAPASHVLPYVSLYGGVGLLFTLTAFFITLDESYKYYLVLFVIFVLQVFLFLAFTFMAGYRAPQLYTIGLSLGPWLIIVFLLWLPPYIVLTYFYNMEREEVNLPSAGSLVLEGVLFAFSALFLVFYTVLPDKIINALVAYAGPYGFYLIITIISLIIMYIGIVIGNLWARTAKYKQLLS
jgi:hypothetical protein